jgi:hypothetical protein
MWQISVQLQQGAVFSIPEGVAMAPGAAPQCGRQIDTTANVWLR